jgi:hypothetical protein
MPNKIKLLVIILLSFVALTGFSSPMQPPKNLLQTPIANATTSPKHWTAAGEATIEKFDGILCYVVRNGGKFSQVVNLPPDAAGQYVVLIGRGSAERANENGSILDLPSIYGQVLGEEQGKQRILALMEGRSTIDHGPANTWAKLGGIFKVPEGAKGIRFFLSQGELKDLPHNGAAARFDDLGLYLFPTESDARTFVSRY